MVSFKIAYEKTLAEEGGLNDNPNDLGGLTIMGVCYRDWNDKYPNLFSHLKNYIKLVDLQSIYEQDTKQKTKNIREAKNKICELCLNNKSFVQDIQTIYKTYWDLMKLDLLNNQSDANTIFDFGFNAGSNRAIRYCQRLVKVKEDGIMGKITAHAINTSQNFTNKYNDSRKSYYTKISKNTNQNVFLKGWINRVDRFYV